MTQVEQQLADFVRENFFLDASTELTPTVSLIDSGIVDSTGIMELVMFLEESFAVNVEDEEIRPENLDSIGAAASFVARKTRAAA